MKLDKLLEHWDEFNAKELCSKSYEVRLHLDDAARIEALAELYPLKSREQLIAELMTIVLDEVEAKLPNKQGTKVIAYDEFKDPIYEDIGPTSKFLSLTRKYANELSK